MRIDRITLGEWLERADVLLSIVTEREAFHARALAARVTPSWVDSTPVDRSGHDAARIEIVLRVRLEALREVLDELPTIASVLRSERMRAAATRDRLHELLSEGAPSAGAVQSTLLVLATQLASMLELRILAERAVRSDDAERLDAERARWVDAARGVLRAVLDEHENEVRGRPLEGRVVLVGASSLATLARLTQMLERAGATTVLASSRASAESLLRWFHVDAVLCFLASADDPIACIALDAREAAGGRPCPLFVALLAPHADVAAERSTELGFDAAIPIAFAPRDALTIAMALALRARRDGVASDHAS
ncbi:hypothetical protein [Sandaracinus amylolyticus]|uniref:hypothetical protein n=1 Tax=Sandaracinus amylolyticus TaxID=927083 RepID=UPI001F2AB7EC|nr:hypothetical protein [Sandaracinus amylolyticus]UJR84543.1 Hypothetical protein I5071_66220 [Sandaracinus amylolyticus]